jgi:hypothetical protein
VLCSSLYLGALNQYRNEPARLYAATAFRWGGWKALAGRSLSPVTIAVGIADGRIVRFVSFQSRQAGHDQRPGVRTSV